MNKNDIKRVIGNFEPDIGMEHRLSEKIFRKKNKKFMLKPVVAMISLAMVIFIGLMFTFIFKNPNDSFNIKNSVMAVKIPKMDLPKVTNSSVNFKMIGFIVYQGRIYTQSGTTISLENAPNILGKKLGTTKDSIKEWSNQKDYAKEFASSIGVQDVFTVNGYDKNFRIMTYLKENGTLIEARFYECLNGITVKTGADVFCKLKIENNVKSAKWEPYDSWYYSKHQSKKIQNLKALNGFINELKNTIPNNFEKFRYLFDDKNKVNQKFIYVTLSDGSVVHLTLAKGGYIQYDNTEVIFKMQTKVFNALWDQLL